MQTVDIHDAKLHLTRLVERAARGEPFIIAKAGKPLVKVMPVQAQVATEARRLGFLLDEFDVPEDFDEMGRAGIERLFGGSV